MISASREEEGEGAAMKWSGQLSHANRPVSVSGGQYWPIAEMPSQRPISSSIRSQTNRDRKMRVRQPTSHQVAININDRQWSGSSSSEQNNNNKAIHHRMVSVCDLRQETFVLACIVSTMSALKRQSTQSDWWLLWWWRGDHRELTRQLSYLRVLSSCLSRKILSQCTMSLTRISLATKNLYERLVSKTTDLENELLYL